MVERVRNDISDGVRWRCRSCKTSTSIRDGSFFSKSKLTLQKWLILIFWWSHEFPVTDAKNAAEVDVGTAVDVYRWLREVCSTKLLGMTITLGGPGVVVQIDESLFCHKPKV
jgi:transposase-like protein